MRWTSFGFALFVILPLSCGAAELDSDLSWTSLDEPFVVRGNDDFCVDAPCGCVDDGSGCWHGLENLLGPCDWRGRHRACYGHDQRHGLADKHAPAALMGDHIHDPGEWMVEYKYMNMYMNRNQAGTIELTNAQAFTTGQAQGTNNGATPTSMTMEMHMLHIMYGMTENVTAYVMPMWKSLTMDHLRNTPFPPNPPLAGTAFTTHNSGFSDLAFGALWRVYEGETDELFLNLGMSVPTGDIDRSTTIPTGGLVSQELPYPMRLGSGTVNARPAVTYKSYYDHGSIGLQYQTDLPIGSNDESYNVSKIHRLNAWYSWLACDRLAFSYRVESLWKSNYTGGDPDLNPAIISTSRPDMRGGQWINFGYGAMLLVGDGHLLNAEVTHPVYESLNGVQLSNDWWFNVSWSKAF